MVDFAKLREKSKNSLARVNEELESFNKRNEPDTRYWVPTKDKAGNGLAIFRWLPAPGDEDLPYVRLYDHGFKHPRTGKYYIENSLSTLGEPDPVYELNSKLFNSGVKANKDFVSQFSRRRLHYISGIYMIKDTGNPENNGKVFLFKYGKKIFTHLQDVMQPPEGEDTAPLDPFNLWEGANFTLKIRKVEGYPNYDKSSFDKPSPLFADDEDIEAVWRKAYSLQAEIAPSKFKSYSELKARLDIVMGNDSNTRQNTENTEETSTARKTSKVTKEEDSPPWDEDESDEATNSFAQKFFQKLQDDED